MSFPNLSVKKIIDQNIIKISFTDKIDESLSDERKVIFHRDSLIKFIIGLKEYIDNEGVINLDTEREEIKFHGGGHDSEPLTAFYVVNKESGKGSSVYIPDEAAPILLAELEKIAKEEGLK